jgi:hypothetical protein
MYRVKGLLLVLCVGWFGFEAAVPSSRSALPQPGQTAPAKPQATRTKSPRTNAEFETTLMGEMRDEDGTHLGFTNFKAFDGTILIVLYTDFDDPKKAQAYFEKQLGKAVKIIVREKKLDAEGKVVGERAEILLRLSPRKSMPAVLWVYGVSFHEIYSNSSKKNLELEKWYKH